LLVDIYHICFELSNLLFLKGECKPETRKKLLAVLTGHGESKRAPTSLLKLFIWTLGHFPQLSPGGTQTSLDQLLTLGNKVSSDLIDLVAQS
jgi:hypothetical protein